MEVGDAEDFIEESLNPRKRQSYGRLRDATKRLRAQSFELGYLNEQKRILDKFNEIGATSREPWNAQSSYLAGLISVLPVNRRRSREADQAAARTHDCTFGYRQGILQSHGDGKVCGVQGKFREECEVNKLEDSVIEQEQYSRVENLEKYVVSRKRIKRTCTQILNQDRRFHPHIVVQFARRSVRGEWLAATKTRFHSTDLHETFSPGPVFVNEHLTLHTKDLLWRCKTKVKDGSLAYAWYKDGKVYVCHTEKSRAIRVYRSVEEIDRVQRPRHGK
ncbi:hypothetical protein J6590_091152 [Homalodisca vitripennis]|nr:hypothetical protein J6590_091152 [Homalodisca vitripennis]